MTDWDTVGRRVKNSKEVIGHPQQRHTEVKEGVHYRVAAHTTWCDHFIPTVIIWNTAKGDVSDSFTDLGKSNRNKRLALEHADAETEIEQ